ncbi:hypothetical protein [Salinibacterium sp. ZJ70]|uniref:hypothetical protein n=1 Tax=Salinibacterium sp. ZJ70 TaxID=2708084 RepID=UPI0014234701|nr:hypothetical protein [Salinibacterium sp. ZJ70]
MGVDVTDERETTTASAARDPLPAVIIAAAVFGWMIISHLVSLVGWVPGSGADVGMMSHFGRQVMLESLPFAAGVFLVLWLLPVRSGDRLLLVLAKGLLAAAAGATLAAVAGLAFAGIQAGLGWLRDLQHLSPMRLPADIASVTFAAAPLVILAALLVHLVRRGERF